MVVLVKTKTTIQDHGWIMPYWYYGNDDDYISRGYCLLFTVHEYATWTHFLSICFFISSSTFYLNCNRGLGLGLGAPGLGLGLDTCGFGLALVLGDTVLITSLLGTQKPVSYTHLTLPTILRV